MVLHGLVHWAVLSVYSVLMSVIDYNIYIIYNCHNGVSSLVPGTFPTFQCHSFHTDAVTHESVIHTIALYRLAVYMLHIDTLTYVHVIFNLLVVCKYY